MRTYIFFINVLFSILSFSQGNTEELDSTYTQKTYGIRVGVDISKLVKSALINDYTAFEINADYRISKKYYLATEIGGENRRIDDIQINYTTSGQYIKVGVDYNAYVNWLDMNNAIFVGGRYGLSTFSQTLHSFNVFNSDDFWGESNSFSPNQEFSSLSAHWLELIVGLKAEVLKNLFLGINAQLKNVIVNDTPDNFDNLYIPGFGRTHADTNWGVGFGYTISYLIPILRK